MAPYFEVSGNHSADQPLIGQSLPLSEGERKILVGERIILSRSDEWPYVNVAVRILSNNHAKVFVTTNNYPDKPALIEEIRGEIYCGAEYDKESYPAKKVKTKTFSTEKKSIFSTGKTWVIWRAR